MSSVVQICNVALSLIGARSPIQDLEEDSIEALQCNLHYEDARDAVLADFPWSFATRVTTLAETGTAPMDWLYQYACPDECLKVREIVQASRTADPIPFEVMVDANGTQRLILTDQADASLRYTMRVVDPNLFPPLFRQSLSLYLSSALCMPLSRDLKIMEQQQLLYRRSLHAAWAHDANEHVPDPMPDADWIQAR